MYTEAAGEAATRGAEVTTRHFAAGELSLRACLRDLREACGARLVVSEGGPTLLRELLAERLVDELVLTIAPMLVAGDGRSVVHGPLFDPPAGLRLEDVLRAQDHLFLRYVPVA